MYPTGSSSNIGNLLRLIQEDTKTAAVQPNAQVGSPIRDVVQGPLQSPEDPGSSRVVSLKPEGTLAQAPQQAAGAVIAPSATAPITGGVIAPTIPIRPVQATTTASAPSAPSNPSPSISSVVNSTPNVKLSATPKLGTSIKYAPSVLGAATSAINAPSTIKTSVPSATLKPDFSNKTNTSSAKFTPTRTLIGPLITSLPKALQSLVKQYATLGGSKRS